MFSEMKKEIIEAGILLDRYELVSLTCGSLCVACGLHVHIGVTDIEYLLTRYAQTLEHRVHRVRIGFGDGLRRLSDAQLHRITEKSVDECTGNGVGLIRQNGVLGS